MAIYDISHPHDLQVVLGKPFMTTDEIDAFIADPSNDPDLKRKLLEDVQPQGYTPSHSGGTKGLDDRVLMVRAADCGWCAAVSCSLSSVGGVSGTGGGIGGRPEVGGSANEFDHPFDLRADPAVYFELPAVTLRVFGALDQRSKASAVGEVKAGEVESKGSTLRF